MDLIDEAKGFYKNGYLLMILNIFYNYVNYFLCILYICWFPIHIIINNNLTQFANENYINYYLILYAFYRMYLMTINFKYNINKNIIASIIFVIIISYDINNNNNIHKIQYWIFYNLMITLIFFVYGTIYLIFNLEINNTFDKELYIEYTADIISDTV